MERINKLLEISHYMSISITTNCIKLGIDPSGISKPLRTKHFLSGDIQSFEEAIDECYEWFTDKYLKDLQA